MCMHVAYIVDTLNLFDFMLVIFTFPSIIFSREWIYLNIRYSTCKRTLAHSCAHEHTCTSVHTHARTIRVPTMIPMLDILQGADGDPNARYFARFASAAAP